MKRTIVLLALVIEFSLANAQDKGDFVGKVVDKTTKQPLIGVNVVVTGTGKGASTNSEGVYVIKGLQEDVYKLTFSYIGYASYMETDLRIVRNKVTQVREIELEATYIESETITVAAGFFREDSRAPVSHYTYSREEIRRSPGATGDIFRAIETLPGVSSSGGEFSAFSVRGGSPRDNIVLVDNIPFDRVSHFDGGSEEQEAQGGRFSILAPGLIEEANFQAGGFSARYGGKNASFVDLKIKEGNKSTMTVNGTYDLIGWEVNYDGPSYIMNSTSLMFSARSLDFNDVLTLTGQKDLGNPSFTDVIVKTTTEVDPSNKLSLLVIYAPEHFDRTIDHVFESEKLARTDLVQLTEGKNLFGLNYRTLINTNGFLLNTLYYSRRTRDLNFGRAHTDFINGFPPKKSQVFQRPDAYYENNKEIEMGFRSNITYLLGGSRLLGGVEIARVDLDYKTGQNGLDTVYVFDKDDYRPSTSQPYIVRDPKFVNSNYQNQKLKGAAFVEHSGTIGESLTLTPGIRYEFNEFNNKGYLSPRMSASYRFHPHMTLNAATGIYYQAPEYQIIAAHPANPSLNHQKAYHLIAGLTRYVDEDIKLTAEVYYKRYEDLIVMPDRTTTRRVNDGNGWASGIDIGLVKRFVDKWYGQMNYSFAQSKRDNNDREGWYDSDFHQPHVFNILFGYELNKEWSFSAKWKYATGRPKDSYIIHTDIFNNPSFVRYSKEITKNNAERLADFHTFNLRIDYRKQIGPLALVGFLDILNLYSRLNVNEERFLEMTGTNEKLGFEIIPTFGLKLEF